MARNYTLKTAPSVAQSEIDYRAELNDQQYGAVSAPPGPALVIAGAGSGKTRTLTFRVAYLLDNGIRPENILLLTFTNKAAREMLERVRELVPHDTRDLWGGTFHSIGNKILRRHADRLGFDRSFSIMDRDDQKEIMSATIDASSIDTKLLRFPKPDLLINLFSLAQNTGESLDEILESRYPYLEHLREEIAQIWDEYEQRKLTNNSMDFDDLLIKTLEMLKKHRDLRETYQRQFEFVLVDEYQDTNLIQAELIDLLAARTKNVTVVGDDAQSIYSWRGADFRNILEFPERYEGAAVHKIETNYRSVPEILSVANAAILPNTEQFEKTLSPHRPKCSARPALIPINDPTTQAHFIAQRIEELQEEGVDLSDIAVLYRAHFHSMEIQMQLTRRGIPFMITSGLRFFEQAHVKDVASFMKIVANRKDEVAFKRMAQLLPAVGKIGADKLWRQWLDSSLSDATAKTETFSEEMLEFRVPAKAKSAWEQLAYTLDELIDTESAPLPPSDMMPSILEGVYNEYMQGKFDNFDSRSQDLAQLETFAEDFSEVNEFLSQLSLLAGQDAVEAEQGKAQRNKESVCLSSVHQAKGLEWKVVFVVWLTEGMFPNNRVLEADQENDNHDGEEEERRLFYVAVTRAMDELYLMYPLIWAGNRSGNALQEPSRFLRAIPPNLMEEWNVGSGW